MPFVVGENIGPYRIIEQLGRGGMATVFKAYHAALDRYVAIKALHPAFMEDPNFHARFQREARVVAKLEHPNIVPIYDFAEYESRPYLVMKYIEGDTLKARLTEGGMAQNELIEIVEAVGAGLSYAHKQGILHRDIKPSNVLLGADGRVYLADFGLARIAQAGESTLSSDMMLGTPQYISPEQAMGLGELDERTDIYSFGVMLYEMSVGKVPFSADTPFSIIHDHIYTPLPLPSVVNPNVTEAVERVLLKALAKERDDRYSDANDLAIAFKEALLAEPGTAPAVVEPTPEQTFIPEPEPEPELASDSELASEVSAAVVAAEVEAPLPEIEESLLLETAAAQPAVSPIPEKGKRRFRWWFIPLGIVIIVGACFCGLTGLGALMDLADNGRIDPPLAEQLPEEPAPEPFRDGQSSSELDAPPLDEAQQMVEENPEDPYVWLELARSHWQVGQVQEGREAINRALDLASDDADFYFNTADELAEAQLWVEAAHLYLQAIQRFYPGDIPRERRDQLAEAAYWAAEIFEAEKDIPIARIAEVDASLERVVKARYEFYHGDPLEAEKIVEEVLTNISPGMPEAMLFRAEMFYEWGDPESAFEILFELLERDEIPDWIYEYLEYQLEDALSQLDEAQTLAEEHPDDAWLQLDLFSAYLSAGMLDEAEAALQRALELSADNPEVSIAAGDIAASNGFWLRSAQLYGHAAKSFQGDAPPELAEKIVEALYYGAGESGAPEVFAELEPSLPGDEGGVLRLAFRDTLIARYKLYYEDIDEARAIIEDVVGRTPDLPLPRLVQAEVYLFTGDISESEAILRQLKSEKGVPPWMQQEIQLMLDEINPDS